MSFSPEELEALSLSLKVSFFAILWGLPLAIVTAYILARKFFPLKTLVEVIVHAPIILPPVIIGYFLLQYFGPSSSIGIWLDQTLGFSFSFNWKGASLAAGIMAFPLMVRAIKLSFETNGAKFEWVARTLGSSPLKAFFTITLPMAFPGILTGGILGFARALGEFGATITFVSSIPGLTQTLPLSLFKYIETPGGEDASFRIMILSLGLALGALILSEVLARRIKVRNGVSS
ncbi:MAG: molybdate ABC transporter permease subunit [Sphingomonadales bacterium]